MKLLPGSAENEKLGEVSLLDASGLPVIITVGAVVSIVQV